MLRLICVGIVTRIRHPKKDAKLKALGGSDMKKIFVCMIVLVVMSASLQAAVSIPDANLKAAIKKELNITHDPNESEMLLLKYLKADSNGISNLIGLEYATHLLRLYVNDNNISSLVPLTSLPKLKTLSARNNNISSMTPLKDITTLMYLFIPGNNISDINDLKDPNMNNLRELDLSDNFISDINALSGLTNLTHLRLRYNDITDINDLESLTNLIYLYVSYNENITDINALKNMNSLVELGLTDVNLSDISPLADVNQIKILWLGYNQIQDINVLTKFHLAKLDVSFNRLNFESLTNYLKQIMSNSDPASSIVCNWLINDRFTDMNDMQLFASRWLRDDCNLTNYYCNSADFGGSGNVDFWDFAVFAEWWMYVP